MELLIWFAVIWFLVSSRGRWGACGGDWRRERRGSRLGDVARGGSPRTPRVRSRAAVVLPQELPFERAKRDFVEGRLTVEQYEAELDRLIRRSPQA
ncbi:MAG: hypothetical protein ACRELD_09180 [Longimicrobiales bacterium]